MKQKIKLSFQIIALSLALLTGVGLFAPQPAQASVIDSLKSGQICEPDNTPNGYQTNLGRCVNNIYIFAISIGSFIAVLMFVLAGYLYIQGTEETVERAKSMMGSTLLGLGILFGTYLILQTIDPDLTRIPSISVQSYDCNNLYPDHATNRDTVYQKAYQDCVGIQNGTAAPSINICENLYPDATQRTAFLADKKTPTDYHKAYDLCIKVNGSGSTGSSGPGAGGTPTLPPANVPSGVYSVNSVTLSDTQKTWISYIATKIMPRLQGDQITQASVVAWWALREGVLDLRNPLAYSLCHKNGSDTNIGATEVCPRDSAGKLPAWQVGIAASQVYYDNRTVASIESVARSIYPGKSIQDILSAAATEAGYLESSTEAGVIRNATGDLEMSWLLRDPAIGFTVAYKDEVNPECYLGQSTRISDCYSSSATGDAKNFASSQQAMLQSIADIRELLTRASK